MLYFPTTVNHPVTVLMIETFTFLPLERVHYGPGSLAKLPVEVERLGASRVLIVTGRTVAEETPLVERTVALLGPKHAGTFAGVRQHVPQSDVARAAQQARDLGADLLVSLGGGSAVDGAKALAWQLAGDGDPPPHIAIPTTLSAAEFSHIAGYTVEGHEGRSKDRHRAPALTPRAIILDAQMTEFTPDWLWASSGIRALDHAVETLYAPGEHPVQSVLALEAIRELFVCLPASTGRPQDHHTRQRCQLAAWMSLFAPAAIQLGLSHTLSKAFGTTYEVPHGVTSCITLPHTMRHMATTHAPALARMARALDVADAGAPDAQAALAAVDAVSDLIARLDLPARLRDVDVPREAIPHIARAAVGDGERRAVAERILEAAW